MEKKKPKGPHVEPTPAPTARAPVHSNATTTGVARLPLRQRQPRLSASVSEELIHRIVSGEYAVGSSLPPEPLLVEEFEVSRPVVREAVKSLESAGLVAIRQGDGTVVRDRALWSILDPRVLRIALAYNVGSRLTDDATTLRAELEGTLIVEAAGQLTEADFDAMLAHLHVMDTATELAELQASDLAFHQIYRERSGNELKASIVRLLVEEMPWPERITREGRAMYDFANRGHWAIYRALREGRVDDAVEAVTRHVVDTWTYRHS